MHENWQLNGMKQDQQGITNDWQLMQKLIHDVVIKEVKNVPTNYGYLTEIFRQDWNLDKFGMDQVFQAVLEPGGASAWHAHAITTDRLFISYGRVRIVLYDSRKDSPTLGLVNEFRFGSERPAMLVIPPTVWHGIENIKDGPSIVTNVVDHAYHYEGPDHYRLPIDTPEIPYKFRTAGRVDSLGGVTHK